MNTHKMQTNEEIEIDLSRVVKAVMKKLWIVAVVTLFSGILSFIGTKFFIKPKYQSTAMFYVNNNNFSLGDTSLSLSTGDISASRNLVNTYIVVLNTRSTLTDVIDYSSVDYSYDEIKKMISASAVDETEIFKVVVTSTSPEEAENIADAITYILPKRISTIIDGTSAKIVDTAVLPSKPSSPNVLKNTVLGALLGMIAVVGAIALIEIFDTTIRIEEDIEQITDLPILASVPDIFASSKDGAYSSYYSPSGGHGDKASKRKAKTEVDESKAIGSNLSFVAAEAFKMLRTKVQFSFADDKNCYVVGISSALAGEGKSVISVNLAYSLSQLNKKVLLIDCDMRKPTLHSKMKLRGTPGISNYLIKQADYEKIVQTYADLDNRAIFNVIPAGTIPPNPVELLSSSRMEKALESFKNVGYDYIILDLPPIGEVTDAMVAARHTDGMLIASRMNHGNKNILADALKQFEFVNARILGIVANCVNEDGKAYGYNKYGYGKYKYAYQRKSYYKNNRK